MTASSLTLTQLHANRCAQNRDRRKMNWSEPVHNRGDAFTSIRACIADINDFQTRYTCCDITLSALLHHHHCFVSRSRTGNVNRYVIMRCSSARLVLGSQATTACAWMDATRVYMFLPTPHPQIFINCVPPSVKVPDQYTNAAVNLAFQRLQVR